MKVRPPAAVLVGAWLVLWGVAGPLAAGAQSFTLENAVVAGGGGASSGGVIAVNGTIGQPTAAVASGGTYSLETGFWALYNIVQTPGAPTLTIVRLGGVVEIRWPESGGAAYVLEGTSTLGIPGSWSGAGLTPVTEEGVVTVSVTLQPGVHFYRLRKAE